MKKSVQQILLVFILMLGFHISYSQMTIDITKRAEVLVKEVLLSGDGVKVGNIQFTGSPKALGYFEVLDNNEFGIQKGLALSTGQILSAMPNSMPNRSDLLVTDGDIDLRALSENDTYDAAVLEFDFVPMNNKVSFQYIFASEEFVEFTGSKYNDVFAFFISGPAIEGKKNMAIIPNTKDNVSINTVNQYKNSQYFVNNNIWQTNGKQKSQKMLEGLSENLITTTEYDGMTTVLTAQTNVIPFKKYHFKIAIAEVSDRKYNSAVFLKGGSFKVEQDSFASEEFAIRGDINPDLIDLDAILKSQSLLDQSSQNSVVKSPEPIDDRKIDAGNHDDNHEIVIDEEPVPLTVAAPVVEEPTISSDLKAIIDNLPAKFDNIMFNYNSADLTNSSLGKLSSIVEMLNYLPNATVKLTGHTDARGSSEYNAQLSKERVNKVYSYFINQGISPSRIQILSYGESRPISDNNTALGRSMNRRVEILFLKN